MEDQVLFYLGYTYYITKFVDFLGNPSIQPRDLIGHCLAMCAY